MAGWIAVGISVLASGVGAWLIVDHRWRVSGVAVSVAVVGLTVAGTSARGSASPRLRVLDGLADRTFDAAVLGAIIWTLRTADPSIALGALVAMSAGFLASYVRVRGSALGYSVPSAPVTRALRAGPVAIGLLVDGWLGPAVWTCAAVGLLAALVRASQVVKEERL